MADLVEVIYRTPLVSTFNIYEKLGYSEHRMLKRIINENREAFEEYGDVTIETQKKVAGRPTEAFLLNERQFTVLVTYAKNTPQAKELKRRVVREFYRLKDELANMVAHQTTTAWVENRDHGKIAHNKKADAVKKYVGYCADGGSKRATNYYRQLAKMENDALFTITGKHENVRDELSAPQLAMAAAADSVIEKALTEGMHQEMEYHALFIFVKSRVVAFAGLIGKSPVHDLLPPPQLKLEST